MNISVDKLVKKLPYRRCYILSSTDYEVRFNGSSGGFVTGLAHYLFKKGQINSAVCFNYTGKALFKPKLVFSEKQYIQTGSVYHEICLARFLRDNIDKIQSPLYVTCLPCQCQSIRRLLGKHNIDSVIVSLVCSGQLTKQATYDFLLKHKIEVDLIRSFCYRGKGWPSGISIEMLNGQRYFFHNVNSDWKCFFHSAIYNLNRCFNCTDTYGTAADLSAADPWLKKYKKKEKVGCTVVCVSDDRFIRLIEQMINDKDVKLHEIIELSEFVQPQYWTIAKKESYRNYKFLNKLIRLFRTKFYHRLFLQGNYRYLHFKLYMRLLEIYKRKLYEKDNNC